MTVVVVYVLAAIAAALFIGSQVLVWLEHRAWMREGEALSKAFDALLEYRATYIDPLVAKFKHALPEEKQAIKADVADWLEAMEAHGARRTAWARRVR